MDLNVQSPVLGIDIRNSANLIDDRAAAEGTQNVDFDAGVATAPFGFSVLSNLLESGEKVMALGDYMTVDGRVNIVAATETKIHQHNIVNDVWDELAGDTIDANERYPVSFANILHQDSAAGTYQNLLICDGGRSEILRWPGNGENLVELLGGDGYNLGGETGHRALQVRTVQNRAILISPYEYDGAVWIPNASRVRWPQTAKLLSWTGTGSGFVDLIDTSDVNVRAELFGYTLYVYQRHSIWSLRYAGGAIAVFKPDIMVSDKGLLSYRLLCPVGGFHAIVANDYNVYLYGGGSSIGENIGAPIADLLKADLVGGNEWEWGMSLDAGRRCLWIFVSRTKAYKLNLRNRSWTVRDLSHKYTGLSGIMCAALLASGVYQIGETYQDAVTTGETYTEALAGTAVTLTETPAATAWNAGGTDMTGTGSTWKTAGVTLVSVGDIVHVISGTNATAGYYMVATVTDDTHITLDRTIGASPSAVIYTIFHDDGDSYADEMTEIRNAEKLAVGDSDGYVLTEDDTLTTDDGTEPTHRYVTKEYDGGFPDVRKRIDQIVVDAKYPAFSSSGTMTIEYKINDGAWTTLTPVTLSSNYGVYKRFINRTCKKIQFRLGGPFVLRSFRLPNVQIESDR